MSLEFSSLKFVLLNLSMDQNQNHIYLSLQSLMTIVGNLVLLTSFLNFAHFCCQLILFMREKIRLKLFWWTVKVLSRSELAFSRDCLTVICSSCSGKSRSTARVWVFCLRLLFYFFGQNTNNCCLDISLQTIRSFMLSLFGLLLESNRVPVLLPFWHTEKLADSTAVV